MDGTTFPAPAVAAAKLEIGRIGKSDLPLLLDLDRLLAGRLLVQVEQ